MSVLVKDMEMPRNCCMCWFSSHDFCLACGKDAEDWFVERPSYCPLIELPDHGDLIERDELMKHAVYMPRDGGNLPLVYMSYVKAAKTVIPAERSADGRT